MTDPSLQPELPLAKLGRALRRLRREQAEPSLRDIARTTAVVDAKRQLSHTTVAKILECDPLPPWDSVRRVVVALGGEVNLFKRLWIEAKDAQDRAVAGSTPSTADPASPVSQLSDPSQVPFAESLLPALPRQSATSSTRMPEAADQSGQPTSEVQAEGDLVTRVDKSDLGPMEPIAKGAVGEVFRLVAHALPGFDGRQLAYKEILSTITNEHRAETIWSMERSVALRNAMSSADRAELDRVTAWPLAVVQENGKTVGTIMPLLPADFFVELDTGDGQRENRVHAFAFLAANDLYIARMGIDRSITGHRLVRLGLVAQLAYAISLLHKYDIVYGDLSLANIAIAVNPPRALLLDCDAVAPLSDRNRGQLHTPSFMPPENLSGAQKMQDLTTDVYKLGLCILRGLATGAGTTQLTDPQALTESLSQDGIDLVSRALSPDRSERPTAHQISLYFVAYLANQIALNSPAPPPRLASFERSIIAAPRFGAKPIYICYQRPEPHAGLLLAEYLANALGSGSVFINVGGFDPGMDIPASTDRAVSRCSAMLVVIGPNWSTVTDSADVPCIMDPEDPMRLELEYAFERNVLVIPVLIDNARRPPVAKLPPSLAELAKKSPSHVRSTTFKNDTTALADQLERMFMNNDAADNPDDSSDLGDFV